MALDDTKVGGIFGFVDNERFHTRSDSGSERIRNGRPRFNLDNDEGEEDDDGYGFGFRNNGKRRKWWSDESWDDYDDDDDDDGFGGLLVDSIDTDWIFKVFQAFGWIIPALFLSMILGTGSNALLMALALPLGQSFISLVIDKGGEGVQNFGGWDELDRKDWVDMSSKRGPTTTENGSQTPLKKGKKLSRRRNRDTSLLMRMLIAFFPFLGTWT
ncbi:hypothetical protein RJ641_020422, partial [Dillenia turbinata]